MEHKLSKPSEMILYYTIDEYLTSKIFLAYIKIVYNKGGKKDGKLECSIPIEKCDVEVKSDNAKSDEAYENVMLQLQQVTDELQEEEGELQHLQADDEQVAATSQGQLHGEVTA